MSLNSVWLTCLQGFASLLFQSCSDPIHHVILGLLHKLLSSSHLFQIPHTSLNSHWNFLFFLFWFDLIFFNSMMKLYFQCVSSLFALLPKSLAFTSLFAALCFPPSFLDSDGYISGCPITFVWMVAGLLETLSVTVLALPCSHFICVFSSRLETFFPCFQIQIKSSMCNPALARPFVLWNPQALSICVEHLLITCSCF